MSIFKQNSSGLFPSLSIKKSPFSTQKTAFFLCLCLFILTAVPTHAALIGHWKLDETSGTSAADSSGSGRTGTLQNMAGNEWTTGMIDGALQFDGINDYISLPRASALETGSAKSATAWFKDTSGGAAGWSTIVGTGDGGWLIARDGNNGLLGAFWLTSGGLVTASVTNSQVNISDGQWHRVSLVYNGSSVTLYVDDERSSTSTSGGSIQNLSNKGVLIGENNGATGRRWKGVLDDVRIYDHALTGAQIAQMYDPQPANAGFEYPNISGHVYNPSGTDWSRSGTFTLSHNGSAYGSVAYSGDQVVVLQGVVMIYQAIGNFEIGKEYVVSWAEANRPSPYGGNDFRVLIDNTVIYATHTVPSTSWTIKTSASFVATSTTHTLKFEALNTGGGDKSVFVDDIIIEEAALPPGTASSPSPTNSATGVAVTADLSWTAGFGAASHDVYFGTSSPGTYRGNQTGTTYDTGTMANGTTYYWRIDEVNAHGTTTGTVWSFTTETAAPPSAATNPSPANSATGVAVTAALSWTAGSGAASHNVYFGTSSPGAYQGNQAATTFNPGTLAYNTAYYWRIDEVNAHGTTTGTVWSFTTAADAPLTISNMNKTSYTVQYNSLATGQLIYIDRTYTFTTVPTAYQGKTYIKTANADKTATGTSFLTFNINKSCTVYVAHDDTITTKPSWLATFTDTGANLVTNDSGKNFSLYTKDFAAGTVTLGGNSGSSSSSMYSVVVVEIAGSAPAAASNPNPANSATGVSTSADLSWTAGSGATSHDVYFGTASPGTYQGNQTGTTFDPGTLANSTTYYWRINEVNSQGTTTGTVWSFTTQPQPAPGLATNPSPADGAVNVSVVLAGLSWDAASGATSYNVYGGASFPLPFMGTVTGTSYPLVNQLYYSTTYSWRVDAVNASGTTTGTVWSFTTQTGGSAPGAASNPSPGNGANGIATSGVTLSWTAGAGATSHDVYFGNSSPGTYRGNQTATTYATGVLTANATYYWRIDSVNTFGTTPGTVWSFTTAEDTGVITAIGYWSMDDNAASTTVLDSAGNNLHGTFVDPTNPHTSYHHSTDRQQGTGSLYFDGVNDYVTLPRNTVLETGHATTRRLSVSAWIKSDHTGAPSGFTTIVGTGDGGWFLGTMPNENRVTFACWLLNGANGQTATVANNTPIFDGQWHYVVGVFDGYTIRLYVDDSEAAIASTIGGTIRNINNKAVLVGENAGATGRYWKGLVDEVAIYDYDIFADPDPVVSIVNQKWHINGVPTHQGNPAEGLLMNVRMVNTVFEDTNPARPSSMSSFNPDNNTTAFINKMSEYYAQGIRAFTVSLQGGMPNYEGAWNSAFNADGTLRQTYMDRAKRVIDACNDRQMVVILSCFYQRQHGNSPTYLPYALSGKTAIQNAVQNVANWIKTNNFQNVVLEIANEYSHSGFANWNDGSWLRSHAGQVELMNLARSTHPGLLVSTSNLGNGSVDSSIANSADFIILHFNNLGLSSYASQITSAKAYQKPVLCNEDDKLGNDGATAAQYSVNNSCGWGMMHKYTNQFIPFEYKGRLDDTTVYDRVALLTGGGYLPPPPVEISVTITYPNDGMQFNAGSDITITADPLPGDGETITKVEFFSNDVKIGERTGSPWQLVWQNVPAGTYILTAKATDTGLDEAVSAPVDIYVVVP